MTLPCAPSLCLSPLQKFVDSLSPSALWETLQETLAEPLELTAEGDRNRTPGGMFIKKAKQRQQAENLRCAGSGGGWGSGLGWVALLNGRPEPQPLRPFLALPCRNPAPRPPAHPTSNRRKAEEAGPTPVELRGYQQRLVEADKAGTNLIFVAPTNSGKTAVAVAHAVHVLEGNPEARVLFLAPTVALATQQAGKAAGCWVCRMLCTALLCCGCRQIQLLWQCR